MERIGLIAGNRKFPILLSEAARGKKYYIVAIGIKGDTSPRLKNYVDKIYWLDLDDFSRMFSIFKAEGITEIVMAGQIRPDRLFSPKIKNDPELAKIVERLKDKKADTVFSAIAARLQESGFTLMNSTTFIEDYLPKKGTLTAREPNFNEWEDVYFGLDLAKEIAYLDIGQTVAVKNKAIVAVEALEGTDNLIMRAGKITRGGAVVVKVSKPEQDMRFDVPVVGLTTIKNLIKAKVSCLAIEAGKTLFIDKEASIKLADKTGIAIVAV